MRHRTLLAPGRALTLATVIGPTSMAANLNYETASSIRLGEDQAVSLRFFGSTTADRFTRELAASFEGVLQKVFVAEASGDFPPAL